MKITTGLLCAAALLALSGCTMGPNYSRPRTPVPPAFRGPDGTDSPGAGGSLGDQGWEQVFPQPELQTLIRTALANNFDLRIAAQHVLEQQAEVKIAHSQQLPSLQLSSSHAGCFSFANSLDLSLKFFLHCALVRASGDLPYA